MHQNLSWHPVGSTIAPYSILIYGENIMTRVASHDHDMQNCIKECLSCHSICLETIQYCLQKGGKHASADHIQALRDCAEACQTSANFMLSSSPLHPRTCGVCAEACERCAKSCEAMGDDEQMKACAEECWRCAESCRKMSGGVSAAA